MEDDENTAGFNTLWSPNDLRMPDRSHVLLILSGPGAGGAIDLSERIELGRDPEVAVFVDDPLVSRRHATLTPLPGGWMLSDNDSVNGTWVNGEKIVAKALDDGDLIQIGASTVLKFTSQTETERALQQRQKLEALGALAGGVAHDFNNLLAIISANQGVLRQLLDPAAPATSPTDIAEALDDIDYATQSAAELTGRLLDLSRQDGGRRQVQVLEPLVRRIARLAAHSFPANVHVALELEPDLAVVADVSRLEQALLNVMLNACDAMPDGGTLAISVQPTERPQGAESTADTWVEIAVRDDGAGMDAATLRRASEPFFTTKPLGRGTGLGLAMVFSTAVAHGGMAEIESRPGKGTTVRVRLPSCPRPAPRRTASLGLSKHGPRASVLLVDDDDRVRRAASRLMRHLGLEVTEASGGSAALELLRADPQQFDVMVLDMQMPDMGGEETFHLARTLAPSLSVLVCSGFAGDQVSDVTQRSRCAFLAKPYSSKAMERAIEDLLARTQTDA